MGGIIAKVGKALAHVVKGESGQGALIAVLLLLALGALMIPPLLGLMQTGLKAGQVHESTMQEYYAADAGVEDGLWQIKNDQELSFPGYDEYAYSAYDPSYKWEYDPGEDINYKDVKVTIENVWVPQGLSAPSPGEARLIIEGTEEEPPKLMITGNVTGASEYQIKLTYYYGDEDPNGENLEVETIGIWLPPGFNYQGNCSLADDPDTQPYSTPGIEDYCSGKAVVWDFASVPLKNFPGATGYPMQRSFTFEFSPADKRPEAALSWIDTIGVSGIYYTWDADVKIYKISSVATDSTTLKQTTVEAHTAKIEVRKLGSAIAGDYHAIGATLMTATATTGEDRKYRNRLFRESSATIAEGDIPSNATIKAAWLYWSGWIEGAGDGQGVWSDDCHDFGDWNDGSRWSISGYWDREFRGRGGGSDADRTLTLNPGVVLLGEYYGLGYEVNISWEQRTEGWGLNQYDTFYFELSADGSFSGDWVEVFSGGNPESAFSYTIPNDYLTDNFRVRFFVEGFSDWGQYVYIDDITIYASAGSSVEDAKVNRVIFNDNQITTSEWQVEPTPDSTAPDSWSYSCYYDATDIVIAELDSDMSGTFTLGHWLEGSGYSLYPSGTTAYPLATPAVKTGGSYPTQYHWTYAGWSLLIIYSSPETKGHQLYLFDTFHYVGEGGAPTEVPFSISGFLAPDDTSGSHLTYFVGEGDDHWTGDSIEINGNPLSEPPDNPWNNIFNSYSNTITETTFKSGIDIDTFDMSAYIDPGDTSAEVILVTRRGAENVAEIYNLVYIILSFRSEVTTGGAISYLIKG